VRLNASAKWLEPHSTRLVIPSLRLAAHSPASASGAAVPDDWTSQ